MGSATVKREFEERLNESFLFSGTDKTGSGTPKNFRFVIMDVGHTKGDRIIELNTPKDLCDLAAPQLMPELEYTGIMKKPETLQPRFTVRK